MMNTGKSEMLPHSHYRTLVQFVKEECMVFLEQIVEKWEIVAAERLEGLDLLPTVELE